MKNTAARLIAAFLVVFICGRAESVRAAGPELKDITPADFHNAKAEPPSARPSAVVVVPESLGLVAQHNIELSELIEQIDLSLAAPAYRKVAVDEVKNNMDAAINMQSLFIAVIHMRRAFATDHNIERARRQIDSILPLLEAPAAEREIRGVYLNPADPLRSPMQVTVQGPLEGGYGDLHPIVYNKITVGNQIYWASFYNLRRAQLYMKKELNRFAAQVNAAAAKRGVSGVAPEIVERLGDPSAMAVMSKESEALDAAVENWREQAPDNSGDIRVVLWLSKQTSEFSDYRAPESR